MRLKSLAYTLINNVCIQKRARRFKNQILCDLHFADVALMECSDFMQQLRSFKPQSLGCAVARRKSSTTLIFPLPPQACSGKQVQKWHYVHAVIASFVKRIQFPWKFTALKIEIIIHYLTKYYMVISL